MWTLCSIGSNQEPARNTVKTISRLAEWFGVLKISPLIETQAVNVAGNSSFLNGLVRFETSLNDVQLKQKLVQLEVDLGRDRDHPLSKSQPRPMDIDILSRALRFDDLSVSEDTPYMDAMLEADRGVGSHPHWQITLDGCLLGEKPSTVYFDDSAGHVRVVDQQADRVQDRLQASFALQQSVG